MYLAKQYIGIYIVQYTHIKVHLFPRICYWLGGDSQKIWQLCSWQRRFMALFVCTNFQEIDLFALRFFFASTF